MIRAALEMGAEHPELSVRKDYCLAAILARLGALLAAMKIPDPVADITPLSLTYLDELYYFADAKAKSVQEAIENANV